MIRKTIRKSIPVVFWATTMDKRREKTTSVFINAFLTEKKEYKRKGRTKNKRKKTWFYRRIESVFENIHEWKNESVFVFCSIRCSVKPDVYWEEWNKERKDQYRVGIWMAVKRNRRISSIDKIVCWTLIDDFLCIKCKYVKWNINTSKKTKPIWKQQIEKSNFKRYTH